MKSIETINNLIDLQVEALEGLAMEHKKLHAQSLGGFDQDGADRHAKQLYGVNYAIIELNSFRRDAIRYITN